MNERNILFVVSFGCFVLRVQMLCLLCAGDQSTRCARGARSACATRDNCFAHMVGCGLRVERALWRSARGLRAAGAGRASSRVADARVAVAAALADGCVRLFGSNRDECGVIEGQQNLGCFGLSGTQAAVKPVAAK